MTEAEARELAHEINGHQGWLAYPEEQPFLDRDNQDWWVKAYHDSMRQHVGRPNPFPMLPISSREDWEESRERWK